MDDFKYEDLVAEETAGREEAEAAVVPGQEAIHDETDVAAHFDAAVTASQERFSGVYNPGPPEPAPDDTDSSRSGGPSVWGF